MATPLIPPDDEYASVREVVWMAYAAGMADDLPIIAPMLAILGEPPAGPGWAVEFKWDFCAWFRCWQAPGNRCLTALAISQGEGAAVTMTGVRHVGVAYGTRVSGRAAAQRYARTLG